MEIPAFVTSVLALLFTIASFWWMNWRKGRLVVGAPTSYAAAASADKQLLIVQLPLVFYNDGAAARIVQNLRLQLESEGRTTPILHFNNTVADLSTNEGRTWSRQFAVEGRKSYASVFVFQRRPVDFSFSAGMWKARIEGKLDEKERWEPVLEFDFHVKERCLETLNSNRLLPYDNDSTNP